MAREHTFNCIQIADGRWQVVNVTKNANVGRPVRTREEALRRVGEFNNPWRGLRPA